MEQKPLHITNGESLWIPDSEYLKKISAIQDKLSVEYGTLDLVIMLGILTGRVKKLEAKLKKLENKDD